MAITNFNKLNKISTPIRKYLVLSEDEKLNIESQRLQTWKLLEKFFPIRLNGGRILVSAEPGTGKSFLLETVFQASLIKGLKVGILLFNERDTDLAKYKTYCQYGAYVFGIPTNSRLKALDKIKLIKSTLCNLKSFDVLIVDSYMGLYELFESITGSKGTSKTGGINSWALEETVKVVNTLYCKAKSIIGATRKVDDARDVLFERLSADSNSEIHLSKKLHEMGIRPSYDLAKSHVRDLEEDLDHLTKAKNLAFNEGCTLGHLYQIIYNLGFIPKI